MDSSQDAERRELLSELVVELLASLVYKLSVSYHEHLEEGYEEASCYQLADQAIREFGVPFFLEETEDEILLDSVKMYQALNVIVGPTEEEEEDEEDSDDSEAITLTILIGNSDDKLTQREWAEYAGEVNSVVHDYQQSTHFNGSPGTTSPFQNYAWVIGCRKDDYEDLVEELRDTARGYRQDSVAVVVGQAVMVKTDL